jgi:NAD-dependent DNA ligase
LGSPDPISPAARIDELRRQVREHEERYYILDDPSIADVEFDALMHELEQLEADYPDLVTADSPTQRVGGRVAAGFATVAHAEPMLSLDNAYSEAELRAFDDRVRRGLQAAGLAEEAVEYVAEMKIDGVSIALTYGTRRSSGRRPAVTACAAKTSPSTCARFAPSRSVWATTRRASASRCGARSICHGAPSPP